jgi:hypothetical protein
MGIGTGRLAVLLVACLVAAGGVGAAIGAAIGGSDSAKALDSIELRKDDRGMSRPPLRTTGAEAATGRTTAAAATADPTPQDPELPAGGGGSRCRPRVLGA